MDIQRIQTEIHNQKLDGWLFFDHHQRDALAYRVLGLPTTTIPTRRWYYMIPAQGQPKGMEHRIERNVLGSLPGDRIPYSTWSEQVEGLRKLTAGMKRVAMQFSPLCAIPLVSIVDGGTVDLVRSVGVEVVSSAELIQTFEARWTPEQRDMHFEAGRRVDRIRNAAFAMIRERLGNGVPLTEFEVMKFFQEGYDQEGLITDHGPIVGVNANASNPHYEPTESHTSPIQRGDWLLIDHWAKLDQPGAVYYDVTWTACCGGSPSDRQRTVFETVRNARDAAIQRVQSAVRAGEPLCGYQVDDACRAVIQKAGFGEFFTHRTGHSIGVEVHGNGANMDNFENHDERRVSPFTCFSIEPGIYLPEFGVRSEVNMFILDNEALVTGEIQREMVFL
ncbi:MAG TPA: M24 family metallopeptidase [Bryobacteraceae bacterium]|nr:M24 family metallopeptidase [Bryobacteraceae bacterium]